MCVCVFLGFSNRPRGPKAPKYVSREPPGITVNAPGRLFTLNRNLPGGIYSHYYGKP